jgi:polyisoprenoid-binding protein YceI
MRIVLRTLALGLVIFAGSSCTAVKVVTHTTDGDPVDAPAGLYHLDSHHWSIVFDVDHLRYARFVMRFDRAKADLDFVPADIERSHVGVVIDAASIDTNVAELDALVAGPEMLDAAKFAEIRFESTTLTRTGNSTGELVGNLTIHGVTRPMTLAVTFNGAAPNPLSNDETLGFSASGTFDRSSFGLGTWFPAVGTEVHVSIQAEFDKPR